MNKLLLIFVAGLAGAGIYFLLARRREDEDEPNGNAHPKDHGNAHDHDQARDHARDHGQFPHPDRPKDFGQDPAKPPRPGRPAELLSRYLTSLQKDIEQYEISTNYSYQFDLREEQRPYFRQVKSISNLAELGLNPEEIREGNALLIEMAGKETGSHTLDWGSSLIFLMDYTAIKARISALTSLYDQLTDKFAADKILKRLVQDKQSLIESYR